MGARCTQAAFFGQLHPDFLLLHDLWTCAFFFLFHTCFAGRSGNCSARPSRALWRAGWQVPRWAGRIRLRSWREYAPMSASRGQRQCFCTRSQALPRRRGTGQAEGFDSTACLLPATKDLRVFCKRMSIQGSPSAWTVVRRLSSPSAWPISCKTCLRCVQVRTDNPMTRLWPKEDVLGILYILRRRRHSCPCSSGCPRGLWEQLIGAIQSMQPVTEAAEAHHLGRRVGAQGYQVQPRSWRQVLRQQCAGWCSCRPKPIVGTRVLAVSCVPVPCVLRQHGRPVRPGPGQDLSKSTWQVWSRKRDSMI